LNLFRLVGGRARENFESLAELVQPRIVRNRTWGALEAIENGSHVNQSRPDPEKLGAKDFFGGQSRIGLRNHLTILTSSFLGVYDKGAQFEAG
jgi:hypothetical protein